MVSCPECGACASRLYRDGLRLLADGSMTQRWLCRDCGYRFSEKPITSKMSNDSYTSSQICVLRKAKNLADALEIKTSAGTENKTLQDTKGKIVELLWHLKNDGKQPSTINNYRKAFSRLLREGADLFNPENTKETLAKSQIKDNTKRNVVAILDCWFKFVGVQWKPPKYSAEPEIPYIPTEIELDQLIAACGKKVATYLQLLKETGARCGEISSLKWTSIDFQQRIVRIKAEKGSNSRISPLSVKALEMLNNLPKNTEKIFAQADDMRTNFFIQRRRIAKKLANSRLLEIHFHTLRHWKATMEQHKTKDPWHVKEILGHKSIQSTEAYIHIEKMLFHIGGNDEFHVKVATNAEEITGLLETGFEYIMTKDNLAFFRKRK